MSDPPILRLDELKPEGLLRSLIGVCEEARDRKTDIDPYWLKSAILDIRIAIGIWKPLGYKQSLPRSLEWLMDLASSGVPMRPGLVIEQLQRANGVSWYNDPTAP